MATREGSAPGALLGAALVAAPMALSALLAFRAPDTYYLLSQEDGPVEWATVWAFVAAAAAHAGIARARTGPARTYGALVAAFCLFVALEEISWGQRLLGIRSPELFLAANQQQELNLHNSVSDALRKLGVQLVLLGYGVALPLLARVGAVRPALARLGVSAPPVAFAPSFVAVAALYAAYPWRFLGEWVELALGVGLLLGGLPRPRRGLPALAVAIVAGVATPTLLDAVRPKDPEAEAAVRRELGALHEDWREGRLRTDCGVHRRLYHLVEEEGLSAMGEGRFAGLEGLPELRARYFLDPWASPYWVMDRCEEDGSRRILVYSTGPNRRRDSTRSALRPDDVAATILAWDAEAGPP